MSENAIVPMNQGGVNLTTMSEAMDFCEKLQKSGVAPKGMGEAAIFAVIQSGAELGLSPMRALSNMKVINGRVGPMGALAKALVRKADVLRPGTGFKEEFTGTAGQDDWTAVFVTHRDGENDPYRTEFSVKDAKRAALWGKSGPWTQYPKRMLMWRAVGFHMDDYYSDVLMGFHIVEVLADYPDDRVPVVMEPLAEPARDPLLDELDATIAEMQPDPGILVVPTPPELVETKEDSDPGPPRQATESQSPLSATMTEEEAAADLAREGIDCGVVKEEDLATPNPDNKDQQGAEHKPTL